MPKVETVKIKPFKMKDLVTGYNIKISVSEQYLTFSVDNRYFYFNRDTGDFDGTGTDLRD